MATFELITSPLLSSHLHLQLSPPSLSHQEAPTAHPVSTAHSKIIPDSSFSLIVGAPPRLATQTQKRAELSLVLHFPTPLPCSKALASMSLRTQFCFFWGGVALCVPSHPNHMVVRLSFLRCNTDHITPLFLKSLVRLIGLHDQVKTPSPGI